VAMMLPPKSSNRSNWRIGVKYRKSENQVRNDGFNGYLTVIRQKVAQGHGWLPPESNCHKKFPEFCCKPKKPVIVCQP
ncbi:hypothetical protein, partial [Oceanisphaera litoralis]|uniref:hypothetical protein n=1 Tax=Oceanisphaera litoralis TaxID=225144 RepID=UPI0019591CA1